jgi:hypothetical protein
MLTIHVCEDDQQSTVIGGPEKVRPFIVPLKNGHDFAYSSLEEYEMRVTWREKSFSIRN